MEGTKVIECPIVLTRSWDRATISKCVACESWPAGTNWHVVNDATVCVGAARSRTRINASLIDAGRFRGTIGTENAFGSTIGRNADHVGQARALGHFDHHLTLRVESARRWDAGIGRRRW